MKIRPTVLALLLGALCSAPASLAGEQPQADRQPTPDVEIVVDVQALTNAMQEATGPVAERMKTSKLTERFADVNAQLSAEEVDKAQLLAALQALKVEMESFTTDWEAVAQPLWDGQDAIAETIDKVRAAMARRGTGQQSAKNQALLDGYDARLTGLAKEIESETDPQRKSHLRNVFANVLSLRKLVASVGRVNLGPATEALQIKIIEALSGLQNQLTMATFEVEKVRVILTSEAEFVGDYVDMLSGMITAEELAKALSQAQAEGQGIGALTGTVTELKAQTAGFAEMMNGFAGELAESIKLEAAKVGQSIEDSPELKDVDIDAEIRHYAQLQEQTADQR